MMRDRIRMARESMHLTQEELGIKSGSSGTTVRNWESGRTTPTDKNILKISQVLGKSVPWLKGEVPVDHVTVIGEIKSAKFPIDDHPGAIGAFGRSSPPLVRVGNDATSLQSIKGVDESKVRYAADPEAFYQEEIHSARG